MSRPSSLPIPLHFLRAGYLLSSSFIFHLAILFCQYIFFSETIICNVNFFFFWIQLSLYFILVHNWTNHIIIRHRTINNKRLFIDVGHQTFLHKMSIVICKGVFIYVDDYYLLVDWDKI